MIDMETLPEILTPKDAAAILGVSTSSLSQFKRRGTLTGVQAPVGRRGFGYHRSEVLALLQQRTDNPRKAPEPPRTRICAVCRTSFQHAAADRRKYCSTTCRDAKRRFNPNPKTTLGIFLESEWANSGLSLAAFARQLGISRDILRGLLMDRLPRAETLAQLQSTYGERLPQTETANQIARERLRKLQPRAVAAACQPEARARLSTALRGKKRNPEATARMLETRKTSQAWSVNATRLAEYGRSPEGRALADLGRQLRANPSPDLATLKRWAADVALRLHLAPKTVENLWLPTLVKRRLRSPGGRPSKNDDSEALHGLMREMGWDGSGRTPHRFDVILGERLGETYITAHGRRERHRTSCEDCFAAYQRDRKIGRNSSDRRI